MSAVSSTYYTAMQVFLFGRPGTGTHAQRRISFVVNKNKTSMANKSRVSGNARVLQRCRRIALCAESKVSSEISSYFTRTSLSCHRRSERRDASIVLYTKVDAQSITPTVVGRKNFIVRPLSTVEYTSVTSLFHCRQWSN